MLTRRVVFGGDTLSDTIANVLDPQPRPCESSLGQALRRVPPRRRTAFSGAFSASHWSMARLICSLTGMPSRSLIARSAAFWSGLIQNA